MSNKKLIKEWEEIGKFAETAFWGGCLIVSSIILFLGGCRALQLFVQ